MQKFCLVLFMFYLAGQALFSQETARLAQDAIEHLDRLLEHPSDVSPATATPLEHKHWFRLETDAHIFTTEVSLDQVAAVLLDLENLDKYYNGKKSKVSGTIVSREGNEAVVDFISVSIGPLGINIRTPYRANVITKTHTNTAVVVEVDQLLSDSETNNEIKHLFATRFAEEVLINGEKYTYIRIYTIDEVNTSILPDAKLTLESSAGPVNAETLELIIAAAKTR